MITECQITASGGGKPPVGVLLCLSHGDSASKQPAYSGRSPGEFGSSVRALLAIAVIVSLHFALLREASADWPLVRGDAAATGAVEQPLFAPGEELEILWTYEAPDSSFEATAVIADGEAYVGDLDCTLHAVRMSDGQKVWTKKFEQTGFVAGSAIADGALFTVDYNGVLRRHDLGNGDEAWQFDGKSEIFAPPNVYEGLVLIVTDAGELVSLDAATGEQQWIYTIDQPLRCWPTVVDGRVLVAGCDALLHAVDVKDGKELEKVAIADPPDSIPAYSDGRLYLCTAGGMFHVLTVKPLAEAWRRPGRGQGNELHAAALSDKLVVYGTHQKQVVALDRATGEEKWSFAVRSRATSSPVIAGDAVYFGTTRGRFYAVSVADGAELWQTNVGGQFIAAPAIADGRLVVGNTDGTLYCIGAAAKD